MRIGNGFGWLLAALVTLGGFSTQAFATVITFSGQLDVLTDLGGARYSGVTLGQTFSGSFSYGTEAQASTDPLFPGDFDFSTPPFGGTISDGTTATSGTAGEPVQVSVRDNDVLDQSTADLINTLLGTSFANGDAADIADIDTIFQVPGGGNVVFGLSFIGADANAWSGLDFANFPPQSGLAAQAIFFIGEVDTGGNLIFEGFGMLDSVTVVPLPAAVWLFAGGLGTLLAVGRRRV